MEKSLLEKSQFFDCFYSLERRFFVLEYRKTHFSGLYCLKRKDRNKSSFWTKNGLTPLEKSPFFVFLEILF